MTTSAQRRPWARPVAVAAALVVSTLFIGRCSFSAAGPGCRSAPGAYWLAAADGAVTPVGGARQYGGMAGRPLSAPITAIAATPTRGGYWLLGADGGVFAFGDAGFFGSATAPDRVFVDLVPSATGRGYWLVTRDGAVRAFGDAGGESPSSEPAPAPPGTNIVGMAAAEPSPGGC